MRFRTFNEGYHYINKKKSNEQFPRKFVANAATVMPTLLGEKKEKTPSHYIRDDKQVTPLYSH